MKKVRQLSLLIAGTIAIAANADDHGKKQEHREEHGHSEGSGISVSASDPIAFRGVSSGAFLLRRDSTNEDLTVKIQFSGSASNGVDYVALPETVTIPAGFHTVGLTVEPIGTGASVPNEWANLTILSDPAYDVGHPSKASVLIKGNEFENEAPTVSITSPTNETTLAAHSDLTIDADAADANDTIEKVSFYANDRFLGSDSAAPFSITWSNVPPGNFALFARAQDQFGKSVMSAPVQITATNPPDGDFSVTLTSPANKTTFPPDSDIPLAAEVDEDSAVQSISFFSGDTLIGSALTAPFSLVWSNVPPGTYSLRAKATGTNGSVSLSGKVKITVTNDLPTITITSPTNNSTIAGPADVSITADATDANGIKEVTFFGDSHALGTLTTAPYSLVWSNVPPGKHLVIAKAVDTYGAIRTSAILITISNEAPTVTLTSPADGTALTAPATIELAADAIDADGIKYVTFWAGKHQVGIDKTAPYSVTLNKVQAGTYTFTARAVDIFGREKTSTPVQVTVAKVPNGHGNK